MKVLQILFLCVVFCNFFSCKSKKTDSKKEIQKQEKLLAGKRILMILPAVDYNDDEYSQVKSTIEDQGAYVKLASEKAHADIKSMDGLWIKSDFSWKNVRVKEWNAFVLIGGSGTPKHFEDKDLQNLLNDANSKKIWIAAICLSPMILAQAGLLQGKKATCFSSIQKDLVDLGVKIEDVPVIVEPEAKIITGRGPKDALLFAFKIVEMISGKKVEQARPNE